MARAFWTTAQGKRDRCTEEKGIVGGVPLVVLRRVLNPPAQSGFVCLYDENRIWCVNPLTTQTTFYITDSSAFRNQVLYFRQDDWEVLCKPLMERLTVGTFEKIPQVCVISDKLISR